MWLSSRAEGKKCCGKRIEFADDQWLLFIVINDCYRGLKYI